MSKKKSNGIDILFQLIGGLLQILIGIVVLIFDAISNNKKNREKKARINSNNESSIKKPLTKNVTYTININDREIKKTENQIIKRRIYQFFESVSIVMTTSSWDTLKGRLEFIEEIRNEIHDNPEILFLAQDSIDRYKADYYDRVFHENQINFLIEESELEIELFYAECIINSYKKYYDIQQLHIDSLKTEKGKQNRRTNIEVIKNNYLSLLSQFCSSLDKLHDLENDIENYHRLKRLNN